ncbi:MAG TPA: hypothetical protein VHO70_16045 [Chitinispirillaceae bacterium]|nr:hypothetical protein [Chitinispirillaceae bacterium]
MTNPSFGAWWRIHVSGSLLTILFVFARAENTETTTSISEFWNQQYSELTQQLITRQTVLSKSAATSTEKVLDPNALVYDTDRDPADIVIRRTEAMLSQFNQNSGKIDLVSFRRRLEALKNQHESSMRTLNKRALSSSPDAVYLSAQALNRELMMASPSLDFTDLLFIERGIVGPGNEIDGEHMCDQYFGHNARTGGGMFILKNFASNSQKVNIMNGVTVPSGTNKGKLMSSGTFLSPELSYDGKTILFAWSSGGKEKWNPQNRFNLFKINIDGTGITRLTDGNFDDMHPCLLPSGRVVFISTRRGGYGRCHQRAVPTYTLFSMKSDGSDIICLSNHETNEFHPSVISDGRLVYTRWDYVDRDLAAAHHIWLCNPDGTNPRAYHGNYATPFNTIERWGGYTDGRAQRPWAEYNARSIPGSTKLVAIAGPHHGQSFGSIILINHDVRDDGKMSQVTRVTPDARFPESEVNSKEYRYGTPWAISENVFLCNYNSTLVLLDKGGSKQVLYTTTSDPNLRPIYPIPVKERQKPVELAVQTFQGERHTGTSPKATVSIMNVYSTDTIGKLPPGVKVKQLRIMQVLAKSTPMTNDPLIGTTGDTWGGGIARMPLGVVPVEDDGSAYFEAPVGKEIFFQLLDSNGYAIQSMRSATYVHSGEQMTCYGCHEDKWSALPPLANRKAMSRLPSKIETEFSSYYPFGFHRNVEPVFKNTCLPCHTKEGKGLQKMDYQSVVGPTTSGFNDANVESKRYAFFYTSSQGCTMNMHQGSRTLPGRFGAMESRMGKALRNLDAHKTAIKNGVIKPEDLRKVTLWLDGNSDELGAFNNQSDQKAGKVVWPDLDVDPTNPTGVEPGPITPVFNNSVTAHAVAMNAVIRGKSLVLKNVPAVSGAITFKILDYCGRCIYTRTSEIRESSNMLSFDIGNVARGSYVVQLNSSGKTWVSKACLWR